MIGLAKIAHSPLRLLSFRRFWLGLTISRLGDQFTIIALLWFVLQLTGSGLALGTVLLCFGLPGTFTSSVLGNLLDRYQPRLVSGVDNACRAGIIGAIPALHWLGVLHLWMVYILAILAGSLRPATTVGEPVFLPHLVPGNELENANALMSVSENFPMLVGPAIAGVLVSVVGGPPVLVIDAMSFIVVALVAWFLPNIPHQTSRPEHTHATCKPWRGFGELVNLREVRIITLLTLTFFLAYYPLEPALPLYSRDFLKAGAAGYGLLWSGFGVGALLGLLTIPWLSKFSRPGITFSAIAVLWGVFLLPLMFIHSLVAAMIFLGLAGCAWGPYTTIETTLLQRLVPSRQRGQVFGARAALTTATGPIGVFVGGLLADHLSASVTIGISGAACIVTGVAGLLSPTLRAVRREAGSQPFTNRAARSWSED
ncbi:MAG: MFS transporter [Chloroflexota bacterium]